MNKYELVRAMAKKSDRLTIPISEKALNAFTEVIIDELKKGEKVHIVGFGTFEAVEHGARIGRMFSTGETVTVKPSKVPTFKASKGLRSAIKDDEV